MNYRSLFLSMLVASPAYATISLNESDSDTPSTDVAEFIELSDGGVGAQPLNGLSIVLFNGSNDSSYLTIDLSGYVTGDDGLFVICGDAAQVAGCDLDVSPDSNLIQNGADAIALYQRPGSDFPNGSAITTEGLVDALVYDTDDADDAGLLVLLNAGQAQLNENMNGAKDTQSLQRCSGGLRDSDGFVAATPTPGSVNNCGDTPVDPVIGACGDTATTIAAIQGRITDVANDASPLLGSVQIIEGIVTRDLQGGVLADGSSSYQYSGFWVQQEVSDNDPLTSEGLFIYDYRDAVNVGDRVRVMGTVTEFNQVTQLSQITDISICAQGQPLPAATAVSLPVGDLTAWEAVEGMRVQVMDTSVVSDLFGTGYGFGNYGQFVVSSRLHFQGTEIALPGSAEALAADTARQLDSLLVDDGVAASYPSFIPFPDDSGFRADNPMRIGYQVSDLGGVMHAYRNNYMVIPESITIDPVNPRTLAPQVAVNANLVVAGMNVLNYFNGDGLGGGFPTSRGAPTAEAFAMQSAKIVAALDAINADIIGLMEIENDGYGEFSAIQTLVSELNALQSAGMEYSVIYPGSDVLGSDEIAVGLIYRAAMAQPQGAARVLSSANSPLDDNGEPLFDDSRNRPALIQSFTVNGQAITVAVNHLKSKGSACGEQDEGLDGQGNCNQSRTRAAQALTTYLRDDAQVMILGDLNAYSQEDPMQVFYGAGFSNLKYTDAATEAQPYSYSFSGMLGSLDHALATAPLAAQVVSVDAWHINSVEDSLVDYLTEDNGQTYSSVDHYAYADAYRSSDHDPVVVGLVIQQANTAPEQTADIPAVVISRRNEQVQQNIADYFTDAEGDVLTFSLVNAPQQVVVTDGGLVSVNSDRELQSMLPLKITVEVSDGQEIIQAVLVIDNGRRQTFSAFVESMLALLRDFFVLFQR